MLQQMILFLNFVQAIWRGTLYVLIYCIPFRVAITFSNILLNTIFDWKVGSDKVGIGRCMVWSATALLFLDARDALLSFI